MTSPRLSRRALLAGAAGLAGAGAALAGYELSKGSGDRTRRLENEFLALDLSPASGAVLQVTNKRRNLELVATSFRDERPPWRIVVGDGSVVDRAAEFELDLTPEAATLRWRSEDGDELLARITLERGDPCARFEIALERPSESPPAEVLEYPVVPGIGSLGLTGEEDRLLHSHATGFLFRNPFELFEAGGEGPQRGLLVSPYPEGFSGSTLQMMAYYVEGRGGFYFGAEDPTGAQKWLNFFKHEDGFLRATVMHGTADVGNELAPAYPVILGALSEGTWTEAADRYKAWAIRQPWCERGPLEERSDRSRWLLEEIGLATFGVNASHDRSPWLERFHEIAGTRVLHILGPNWTDEEQDFQDNVPGGLADWFPARFHRENAATIRRAGDRTAPFLFDLLFGIYGAEREEGIAALQAIPTPALSFDPYGFPFLCPVTRFLRELHAKRDARLAGDYAVDSVYYDISANNVIKQCFNGEHGHPRGGGQFMVDAYRAAYAESKEAMADSANGSYVPQGTEMVNEIFVDRLDYYQARAEASPASAFEGDQFREWLKDGSAEKVPLFAYVYHEYGPVRLDGWGKLSKEQGELFYWIAARVVAWGGIFELNYEYSPLETIDGRAEPLDEHYFPLPDKRYEIDQAKAAFVAELARARTGFANSYLAYGTMLPPLPIESPSIELDWLHYNCPPDWPAYEDSGTLTVDAVVHAAWRRGDAAGIVLVNVDRAEHEVAVPVGASALRLERGSRTIEYVTSAGRHTLGPPSEKEEKVLVTLPSRKVGLIEVKAA